MSWTFLSDTAPKARKDYMCELCCRGIKKGTVHAARRGIGDDGPCTFRMHTACKGMTHAWTNEDWEYSDPHEFRMELAKLKREEGEG